MRRFAAYPREGVAGAIRAVGELQVGLNHITLTRLEFVLPLFYPRPEYRRKIRGR